MNDTLIKIGNIVYNNPIGRIKYHPFVHRTKIDEKKVEKGGVATYSLLVDIDDDRVELEQMDVIPSEINSLKIRESIANNSIGSYLIGNYYMKVGFLRDLKCKNQLFLFDDDIKCKLKKEFGAIFNEDTIFYKYRELVNRYYDVILNELVPNNLNCEIGIFVKIKYKGNEKSAHEYIEVLNLIDDWFFSGAEKKMNGEIKYIFEKSFYSSFSYEKLIWDNSTFEKKSAPYYNLSEFKGLFYGKKINDEVFLAVASKYTITILPYFEGMSFQDLESFMRTAKGNVFNLNHLCVEIDKTIKSSVEQNIQEKKLIPMLLKFDIIYKYKQSNTPDQNFLVLNGIRYSKLLSLNMKIKEAFDFTLKDTEEIFKNYANFNLYFLLKNFFDINGNLEKYGTTIIKYLQNIYQDIHSCPQNVEYVLFNKIQHEILENEKYMFQNVGKLLNTYKFLKIMENKNAISIMEEDSSYNLGKEISKLDNSFFYDENSNLHKRVRLFAGTIKRKIYSLSQVIEYNNDILSKLILNDVEKYINQEKLSELVNEISKMNNFNRTNFIHGYFNHKFKKREKKENKNNNQ